MKTLYMQTTQIDAMKTSGEISGLLVSVGASQISQEFDKARELVGLKWVMPIGGGNEALFSMPVRFDPVFRHLQKQRSPGNRQKAEAQDRGQAKRVAWRQLLRWVQAQVAMIETGMVQPAEIFLPYSIDRGGKTLWERALAPDSRLLLEAAK